MYKTILLVTAILCLCCVSCGLIQQYDKPMTPLTPVEQLQRAVQGTNWLVTLAILGVGAGFFSFLNGGTRGIQVMAACFVVLSLVLGVARYSAWIALIAVVGAVALLAYTIAVKTRAVKEIVAGVQQVKEALPESNITGVLAPLQTKTTQELVKSVKAS